MTDQEDIFKGVGVEITLKSPEDFLKVKETLTRIGIGSWKTKSLIQSCHILHKRGRYVIIHFKELYELDGNERTMTEEDEARRNAIVSLLEQWGMITLEEPLTSPIASMSNIMVIPYKNRNEWNLVSKYNIGGVN